MNGVFCFFRSPIISYSGLTVSGGGSIRARAAALRRTGRLQISVRGLGKAIRLIALIQGTFSETPGLFSSLVHLALKMKLNASCRQVPAASDGALLSASFVDQPRAALPYVAVRRKRHRRTVFHLLIAAVEPHKQAQESVTGCYITCNAAAAALVSRWWRECSVLLVGNAQFCHHCCGWYRRLRDCLLLI